MIASKHALAAMTLSLLAAGCRGQPSEDPPFHLIPDMDHQLKFKAQAENSFFADGRAMRPLVEGTLAQGSCTRIRVRGRVRTPTARTSRARR